MRDIEIAKDLLKNSEYTLVVVKSGQIIFTSNEKGIKPMYKLSKKMKEESQGASIADRVIGRGAALFYTYLNIEQVYGEIISKEAIEVLEKENIAYKFDVICDYIQNRDKTGLCPIEKLSLGVYDPVELIGKIEEFLN